MDTQIEKQRTSSKTNWEKIKQNEERKIRNG